MDWRTLLSTFILVFLAELGDKTQLTTMMLAADTHVPLMVFLGAALGLTASALVGVLLGDAITSIVPLPMIHLVAGLGFIVLGVFLVFNRG